MAFTGRLNQAGRVQGLVTGYSVEAMVGRLPRATSVSRKQPIYINDAAGHVKE